jgi:hypothetical protein
MGGLIGLVALAHAASTTTTITVHDTERVLGGTPKLYVNDTRRNAVEVPIRDDGAAPDPRAGDRKWTGVFDRSGGNLLKLELVGTDGTKYRETVSLAGTDGAAIAVRATSRGQLLPVAVAAGGPPPTGVEGVVGAPPTDDEAPVVADAADAAVEPPVEPPVPVVAPTAVTTSTGRNLEESEATVKEPWRPNVLLGLWGAGIALVGWSFSAARRTSVPAHPVPGVRPELPGRGLVRVTGDADRFVAWLSRHFRVVLAGRAPTGEVPAGMVFLVGPGRVQVEDVVQAVRALEGRGPPVVVVVTTGRLEAEGGLVRLQHSLPRLEATLPAGTHCFVFGEGEPRYRVDDAGRLVDLG